MNTSRHKGLALMILAVSQLMLALDYTIVFVALPSLGADLGFSANHLQWVVSAYSLVYGGFLLLGGRLSDMLGRRRMFMIAIALFGVGSLIGGLASSQVLLIVARGLQGLGGALLSPSTLSLIMSNFDEGAERNRAMSIWAAMGGVGLSLGLLLGGILTSYLGWEFTFFVNVPVSLIALILAPSVLVESKAGPGHKHFDALGTISVTGGMILLVYYLIQSPIEGWLSMGTLPFGLISAALFIGFAVIERFAKEPLVPFRLFRNRNLSGAALTAALFSASFGTLYYFLTLYTQDVLHYSAIQSGLSFLPLTISALLGSRLINKMLGAAGTAGTIAIGMALGGIGFILLTQLSDKGTVWGMIPGTVIIGLGQALVFTTMFIAGGTGIEPRDQGVSSAIVSTGQQIGSSVGLAIIMAIISASLGSDIKLETSKPFDLNHAVHIAFTVALVITLLGILVAFMTLKQKKRTSEVDRQGISSR
ncbi:MFS transporter [Paenibacillus sp. VCA1]|uniref:MFS transporter n=1 Tax=Paenibacillus sp. VCA1 TaxID=3039148 RepID=UPI002871CE34|nr:MFS transporter [Paenibacillus sp. VCA1]MDR9854274.1 MFS transporter [Paenibacillus sp. VCA1]